MNKKRIMFVLFVFIVCAALAGCSLQDKIKEYSSDKEQCYLDTENVTRFSYKGNNYTILADTVSNGGLGEYFYSNQLYCSMHDIDSEVCKKYEDAALPTF